MRQQSGRQTDKPERRQETSPQHSQPPGCRVGVYLVCNSSRAFLPQPQGRGHVFQHLKHVIVTDAPTGDPAQRGRGRVGSTGGVRQEGGGGGSRQENRSS